MESGIPYEGIFRVEDGELLKNYNDSDELSGGNTYFSNFSLQLKNFDNIFDDIDNIFEPINTPFEMVNKQYFDNLFSILNNNNLTIYKSLVTINPQVFDKNNVSFYTLSAPNTDIFLSNNSIHSENVDSDSEWEFLNRIRSGTIVPTSQSTFKYICTTGTEIISLSGSFTDSNLTIIDTQTFDLGVEIQNIFYSESEERLNILQNDQILIYDGLLYKNCDNFILLDVIKLDDVNIQIYKWLTEVKFIDADARFGQKYTNGNPNNPEFIRFGNDYRTSIDNGFLFVLNKYSSDVIESIDLRNDGIENLITANIREIDDKIAILHKEFKGGVGIFITYVDIDSQTTITHKLMEFLENSENYQIKFSNFDSDLIFLSNSKEYQIRSIENSKYPLGKIDEYLLKYLPRFKWSDTNRLFGNPKIKWNTNNDPANNLNIISNDNVFIGDSSYHVIVTNSRFYVIKQKIEDFYKYRITRDLQQQHLPPICSKSSFGQYLNDKIGRAHV
jgi:hypothetical protein